MWNAKKTAPDQRFYQIFVGFSLNFLKLLNQKKLGRLAWVARAHYVLNVWLPVSSKLLGQSILAYIKNKNNSRSIMSNLECSHKEMETRNGIYVDGNPFLGVGR